MKIVHTSDTHSYHDLLRVPAGDMLIFSGDLSQGGRISEVMAFANWLNKLPHKYKIMIAGNHDWLFERDLGLALSFFDKSVTYLQDDTVVIEGLKIHGSPVQPTFYNWAFNRDLGVDIQKHWDLIPNDADILITHGPAEGILDELEEGDYAGCPQLGEMVLNMPNLKLHAFGHIHEAFGYEKHLNGMISSNASFCKRSYKGTNKALVYDLNLSTKEIRICD